MAGYVKLWTTLLSNEKFISLNGTTRNVYFHLLLLTKQQRDDGTVRCQSVASLSSICGTDRANALRALRNLHTIGLIQTTHRQQTGNNFLEILIPNYVEWQTLTAKEVYQKKRQKLPNRQDHSRQDKKRKDQPPIVPLKGDEGIPFQAIIDDLNQVLNLESREKFRVGEASKKDIRARYSEGYQIEDFQVVHRKRAMRWLHDPDKRQYLRPSTLYRASKFPGYLTDKLPGQSELDRMSPESRETAKNLMRVLQRMENEDKRIESPRNSESNTGNITNI